MVADSSKDKKDSKPQKDHSGPSAEELDRTILDIDLKDFEAQEKAQQEASSQGKAENSQEDLEATVMISLEDLKQGDTSGETTGEFSLDQEALASEEEEYTVFEEAEDSLPKISAKEELSTWTGPETFEASSVPEPLSLFQRLANLSYLVFGFILLAYLFLSAIDALRQGPLLRWQAYLVLAGAVLVPALGFLKKLKLKKIFAGLLLLAMAWTAMALLKSFSSEIKLFSNWTLEWLLSPLLILSLGFWTAECFSSAKNSWAFKLPALLGLILLVFSSLLAWLHGLSLEGFFWGTTWMASWPLSLRPGFLALGLAALFFFLSALLSLVWGFTTRFHNGRLPAFYGIFLSLSVLVLGLGLLSRQGYHLPLLSSWTQQELSALSSLHINNQEYLWALGGSRENPGLDTKNHLVSFISKPLNKEDDLW
ncbi:MAG: hypothetical protein KDK66_09425, partial [Deltaproteobacteria bacterium]|nr:hypothetical protein [Deltaproteobacteria bacterium]